MKFFNRQLAFKLISISFGILLTMLLLEIGFRVSQYLNYYSLDDIQVGKRTSFQEPDIHKQLGQIIQLSSHNSIIYELIPNSSYQFVNTPIQTNSRGFRDKEYPEQKAENTKRIIGIGDSFMFGWGIEEEHIYLSKLEDHLNQSDSLNFEVINTGVPGYNTAMEVTTLERKFNLEDVDAVIIHFLTNDFDLPNFIRVKPDFYTLKKSFISEFIEENNLLAEWKGDDSRLRESPFDSIGFYEDNPNLVPDIYAKMVGGEGIKRYLKKLNDLSDQYGFHVIFLTSTIFTNTPDFIQPLCKKYGFEFCDIQPGYVAYKAAFPEANYKISNDDWHPSKHGHHIIFMELEKKISKLFGLDLPKPPASVEK